ncbi:DUF3152 domain-containing protein [Streptomyces sp. NPDC048057]|uniref:DUF3152 domain-containing protein n=1 Tax=Streptomyces sp. NPDC048057 TaxID=3155628 RepID=UPI0033DFEAD5
MKVLLLLVCVGAVGWGGLAVLSDPSDSRDAASSGPNRPDPDAGAPPEAASSDTAKTKPSPEAERPADSSEEREGRPARSSYRERGPGTYTWARGTGARAGHSGRLVRYGVKLEDGTGLDVDDVAAEIDGILRHERGWTRKGVASFQRVSSPPYDMLVHIVSPATTDTLCGAWGLDTGGQVNCANAPDLIVNVRRWIELSEQYRGRPHDYHALIINHEVGHVLGYGHRTCAGPGKPAPAMMQQIKGLRGCTANPWVYDADGELVDGPKVP